MDSLQKTLASLHIKYDWDNLFHVESSTTTTPDTSQSKRMEKKKVPEPQKTALTLKQFAKQREELTLKYYKDFNTYAFNAQLPKDLEVTWSKRMTKTAGFTRMKTRPLSESPRIATIELSVKVIDNEDRLKETLLHEMCHVAAFLVDGVTRPPHGDCFWKWARIAEKGMNHHIQITTCHSYEINKPFKFTCTNDCCAKVYGRHSKKGIDVNLQFCGLCKSSLKFSGKMNPDGTPQKTRKASAFSLFVKEHYSTVKASKHPHSSLPQSASTLSLSHGDVMKALSKMYAEEGTKQNSGKGSSVKSNNQSASNNRSADDATEELDCNDVARNLFSGPMR